MAERLQTAFEKWSGMAFLAVTVGMGATLLDLYGEVSQLRSSGKTNTAQWKKMGATREQVVNLRVDMAYMKGFEAGKKTCKP